jgi:hypothetical protein
MATPLGRARTVALSYALLGAMYLAMIGILSFAIWVGSWRLLWHDLVDMPNSLTKTVAPLVVANAVMAALAFCYLRLNQLFRVITLIASLIISTFAVLGAVSVFTHRLAIQAPVPITRPNRREVPVGVGLLSLHVLIVEDRRPDS